MATLLLLLLLVLLVLFPFYAIYKPPALLIAYLSRRYPDVLWHVRLPRPREGEERLVALTIDDAPSAHTQAILDVLAAHGAHATFFVIGGQVAAAGAGGEAILADIVRAGHELGNHGMRDEPARDLANEELQRQIGLVEGMIGRAYSAVEEGEHGPRRPHGSAEAEGGTESVSASATAAGAGAETGRVRGPPAKYFRPGSGFFSNGMRALVQRLGYRLVLGDIYPHDAQVPYAWLNGRHVLSMLRPGGIIICHDRRSWTVPMLERVLPEMARRGWKAVTLTELLEQAGE